MSQYSKIIFLTILIHFLFVPFGSKGFSFQENPLTKAIQLFDKEKYAEAEPLFKNILDMRPDDFMVNYFYGACRTENGHYGEDDLNYLVKASKEVSPLNIDYYLAVQYHSKNQWEKALAYYKMYKSMASANEQEKVRLVLKMEQCANHVNPFVSVEPGEIKIAPENRETVSVVEASDNEMHAIVIQTMKPSDVIDSTLVKSEEKVESDELESSTTDSTNQFPVPDLDSFSVNVSNEEPQMEPVKTIPANERIKFSVNNEITYNSVLNFKTEEGKNSFEEGALKETELKKVLIRTEILRGKYKSAQSRAEKDSIGQVILSLEGEAYDLKNSITQFFMLAKNAENSYWSNASPEETENFIKEINAASTKMNEQKTVNSIENSEIVIPPILLHDEEIKSKTSKGNSGVTYKIQLGAYSRGIPNSQKAVFNKISILRKVENYTDENGVVVYTTGNLTNYDDAVVMQKQIRQEGIKDPIIAAYLNGKRITLEKAKEIDNNQ
jgi:tetratricopeptide (TPR) repeat protein